jgi:hypothetical protein
MEVAIKHGNDSGIRNSGFNLYHDGGVDSGDARHSYIPYQEKVAAA